MSPYLLQCFHSRTLLRCSDNNEPSQPVHVNVGGEENVGDRLQEAKATQKLEVVFKQQERQEPRQVDI